MANSTNQKSTGSNAGLVGVYIKPELHRRLKMQAAKADRPTSISEVATLAIEQYLDKRERPASAA